MASALQTTAHPDFVPCGGIITSPNIKINKVDTGVAPWMNDHAILYIDITI